MENTIPSRDLEVKYAGLDTRAIASKFTNDSTRPFHNDESFQISTCRCALQAAPKIRCDCPGLDTTLASLKEALQQPFPAEAIQFLPKDIRQENGTYICLALPYANKRVYEDRLNELIFGEWSSPYTPPYAQGNKLIIPATVVILGIAHTDYGEAFLTTTGKNGNTREDANTATEAYSQAFRRACAKFLLGRYLYDLPTLKLPYDPKARRIAVSQAEHIAWVEKLYQARGLLLKVSVAATKPSVPQPTRTIQEPAQQVAASMEPVTLPQSLHTAGQRQQAKPPVSHPNDTFLDWVARQVSRDADRIQGICTYYNVAGLAQLSAQQREDLTRRLQHQVAGHTQSSPAPLQTAKRAPGALTRERK